MIPTIKKLTEGLDIDIGTASEIRMLIKGEISPDKYSDVLHWFSQCYNPPKDEEMILCAINQVLQAHGVEVVRVEGYYSPYYFDIVASYINMGDTYVNTIVLVHDDTYWVPGYKVMSWGDLAERYLI